MHRANEEKNMLFGNFRQIFFFNLCAEILQMWLKGCTYFVDIYKNTIKHIYVILMFFM